MVLWGTQISENSKEGENLQRNCGWGKQEGGKDSNAFHRERCISNRKKELITTNCKLNG